MLARVGILGDIHCEVARLRECLAHFARSEVDAVLAVGDIADGAGDLDETCALLKKAGVIAVAGNHERWLLAGQMRELPYATPKAAFSASARAYLTSLPRTYTFDSPRGSVLLCHGLGDDDMSSVKPDDYGYDLENNRALWDLVESETARFVINGHTHRVMLRNISGLTIVNAGSLTSEHRPVCVIADFDEGHLQLWDFEGSKLELAERWTFEQASRPHL